MRWRWWALWAYLAAPPAWAGEDAAEPAYQQARTAYYELKGDAEKRKLRHHWLNTARKFAQVASRYPTSPRAPDALYTAGGLYSELSQLSGDREDQSAAVTSYQRLLESSPGHRLADDAAFALAHLQAERLGDAKAARRTVEAWLAKSGRGDRAGELKSFLAGLPGADAPSAPAEAIASGVKARPQAPSAPGGPSDRVSRGKPEAPSAPGGNFTSKRSSKSAEKADAEPTSRASKAKPEGGSALAEAIARASEAKPEEKPAPSVERGASHPEPAELTGRPKRSEADSSGLSRAESSGRPRAHSGRTGAAVHKESHSREEKGLALPTLKDIQEKLRGVRVGESEPSEDPAAARVKKAAATLESAPAEVTLAEQLGLKVRRVVVDPGHGGHDTGAVGSSGLAEKEVALGIAKHLAEELSDAGVEVVLTREDDRFLKLEERAQMANEAAGDLFISIHCNSAPSKKLRGLETYSLNVASDRYSVRLAARENASSERGISDLELILADLATKANTDESSRLAERVQRGLVAHLGGKYKGIRDLGHKQALFYVLLGARMPAILVEAAFLSNPEEEKLLAREEYRRDVARAIASSVLEAFGDRMRLAKADW
ncbi:MAG: N-acetylmuramoyl-L-alanine amidase [Myxococcales bacterium]|nr:N-acetylmuramoyl-L-alanine amidase [Myxococcales bacterium]